MSPTQIAQFFYRNYFTGNEITPKFRTKNRKIRARDNNNTSYSKIVHLKYCGANSKKIFHVS
jgi:hypothetical protein